MTAQPPLVTSASHSTKTVELRPSRGLFDLDLRGIWPYRDLLWVLIARELKIRYRQAALGAAWAVIQPVLAVLIFTVIFGRFAKIPSDNVPYPVFALAGMLPWQFFAEGLRRSASGLVSDSELIRKIYFPRLIIPIAMVVAPLVDFAISFVVLIIMMFWYGLVPTWHIVTLPFFLLVAMTLAMTAGLWLGPINVRFRDVMHTLPFMIQIGMYVSPIVYPLSMVPEKWRLLYSLNPMVGVIEGFRWALLGKESPDVFAMAVSGVVVVVLLIGGLVYFKRAERSFADVI